MTGFTIEILDTHCKKQYASYLEDCKKANERLKGVSKTFKPFTFKQFVKENGYIVINSKGKKVRS